MEYNFINQSKEIAVLKDRDLTKKINNVKLDLRKYWDRDYINSKIDLITNPEHRMLIQFLWLSGVRISEAITLNKRSIDFMNYVMTVRWLKSRKWNERVLPMHPKLKDILQVYTASMKSDDYVFP